ncbi:hypothetical protein DP43_2257 [Burkholderia pseudomallei]|nr:hypothetical protein DP43_2257 [Burkholderia pseudomallei]
MIKNGRAFGLPRVPVSAAKFIACLHSLVSPRQTNAPMLRSRVLQALQAIHERRPCQLTIQRSTNRTPGPTQQRLTEARPSVSGIAAETVSCGRASPLCTQADGIGFLREMVHTCRNRNLCTLPAPEFPLTDQVARADPSYVAVMAREAMFFLQSAIGRIQADQPMSFNCIAQGATMAQYRMRFVLLNGHVRQRFIVGATKRPGPADRGIERLSRST